MIIKPVFPDGLGIAVNREIVNDHEKLMSTIKWKEDKSSQGEFEQSQTNLHELTEWQELFEWIRKQATLYWESLGFKSNDLFFTQSWLNCMPQQSTIDWHYHSNSMISGVYYLKTDEFSGGTLFQSTKNHLEGMIQTDVLGLTDYNCGEFLITPTQDTVVLFPSYMNHKSQPNLTSDANRYTIAFNMMPKTLGKENHFNWLKL